MFPDLNPVDISQDIIQYVGLFYCDRSVLRVHASLKARLIKMGKDDLEFLEFKIHLSFKVEQHKHVILCIVWYLQCSGPITIRL